MSIHGHESEMKAATAYERRGMIFVHSLSRTTEGIWILCDPVLALNADDTLGAGKAVMDCLSSSVVGVKHPQSFGNVFLPVLKMAKTKSYKDFVRGAKCVEIFGDGGRIKLFLTKNMGVDEGFMQLGVVKECAQCSDREVGEALSSAFSDSESD